LTTTGCVDSEVLVEHLAKLDMVVHNQDCDLCYTMRNNYKCYISKHL